MIQSSIASGWRIGVQATGGAMLTLLDQTLGRLLDTNPDKVR